MIELSQFCIFDVGGVPGRIKALPLRQQNYCFGDKCGVASAATSAGYCGGRNRKI